MREKKRRNFLSLYMSKLRIKRQNAANASKLGRPRVLKLKKPLLTKDFDSTMSYEQFTTDECPTDNGEYDNVMEMQFTICCEPEENCVIPELVLLLLLPHLALNLMVLTVICGNVFM